MLFEDTEKFGLGHQAQLADFIQEQCAAIGQLKTSRLGFLGIGKGAFLIAEQFGFQQMFGNAGAVEGDHRSLSSWADEMNGACEEVLTCSTFSRDEHGGVGLRDLLGEAFDKFHLLGDADHPVEAELFMQPCSQGTIVLSELSNLQRAGDDDFQLFIVDGFGDVVVGALLHGFDGGFHGSVSGHDEDRHVGQLLAELLPVRPSRRDRPIADP